MIVESVKYICVSLNTLGMGHIISRNKGCSVDNYYRIITVLVIAHCLALVYVGYSCKEWPVFLIKNQVSICLISVLQFSRENVTDCHSF